MATASVGFKSMEARKEINPNTPEYISYAPWYIDSSGKPSLEHQKKRKTSEPVCTIDTCYDRGAKIFQAEKYRKGSCQNCGGMSHNAKTCTERPRKVGAKYTNKIIAADEKIEIIELDYEGKRDRWNGYDPSNYYRVVDHYNLKEEEREKYLKEQKLEKLEEKNLSNDATSDGEEEDDDEAKVDESKQIDFAKVEKRVRTTGGGSTGTVRFLRIREDTAKYLLNLDVNSAHYDPKTRSMREDPLPDADPNEKFYSGDNHYRNSGQALELKQLNNHSWEAFDKGQDMHMQAAPSQAELSYKCFKAAKEKLKSQTKDTIMDKYGNAATQDEISMELLLGQSERQVEYDRAGRIICKAKGQLTLEEREVYRMKRVRHDDPMEDFLCYS